MDGQAHSYILCGAYQVVLVVLHGLVLPYAPALISVHGVLNSLVKIAMHASQRWDLIAEFMSVKLAVTAERMR